MKRYILLILWVLIAFPAFADAPLKVTMCSAETATGTCDLSGSDIIVDVRSQTTLSFDSTESTATSWSCDVYQHSDVNLTVGTGGQKLNVSAITETNEVLVLRGAFHLIYLSCSALDPGAGSVTIRLVGHDH